MTATRPAGIVRFPIVAGLACLCLLLAGAAGALPTEAWNVTGNQVNPSFGSQVSTAGDVNGDGYSDLIIGAPNYDGALYNQGRVTVYHGSPTGFGAASWTAYGPEGEWSFGYSVACIGDLNGDGYDDVVVGAPFSETGQNFLQEGFIHVYLGSPTGLSTMYWQVRPGQAFAHLGWSVAGAGDVNNDGCDDFLIGVPDWDGTYPREGKVLLACGRANETPYIGWTYWGTTSGMALGSDVAGAGDVDADGYADVLVGCHEASRVLYFRGRPTGLANTPDRTFIGGGMYGYSVSTAGDINADGYAEILIGWPAIGEGEQEGRFDMWMGAPDGPTGSHQSFQGNGDHGNLGWDVACAGDVNGDGYSDVFVGEKGSVAGAAGRVHLYYGGATNGLTDSAVWMVDGIQADEHFGSSVSSAGDANGDGYSDLVASAPHYDGDEYREGRVVVWHGRADAAARLIGWRGEENQANASYGQSTCLGDWNGDGYSDIVVGASGWDGNGTDCGKVWAYYGAATAPSSTAGWSVLGGTPDQRSGWSVANAGDVNNDGFEDLLIGAPGSALSRGAARLFLGNANGLQPGPTWTRVGEQLGDEFGFAVASAGDVNADGYADIVIGAPRHDGGLIDQGKAYVFLGRPSGVSSTPAWVETGRQVGARFGHAVASAGDVDADGRSDILIGAPAYDHPLTDEGAAFLFLGSAGGVNPAWGWMGESDQAGAQCGSAVASAGDLDGDGHSDVAVGAPLYDRPGVPAVDAGRVLVYLGTAGGLESLPYREIDGGQEGCSFGASVAAADLDNDGLSDLIAGSPYTDNGQTDEGQVWAFPGPLEDWNVWFANDGNADHSWHGLSIASGGDVTGDGFADIVTGAPGTSQGEAYEGIVYLWNGNRFSTQAGESIVASGVDRHPRVRRGDDLSPLALRGGTQGPSILARTLGRTPLGRGDVRIEVEVKPLGSPFDGTGVVAGPLHDTGPVSGQGSAVEVAQLVSGLLPWEAYRWRMRIASEDPLWKHSAWFTPPGNNATEMDFRVGPVAAGLPETATAGSLLEVRGCPSPASGPVSLRFTLPARDVVRIDVFDATGRRLATVLDELREAGEQAVVWDGRDAEGRPVASGIYFARIGAAGREGLARVVLSR